MKKELRVAIIGHNFMGKAHSNAWLQVSKFFDPPLRPVLQVACGRDEPAVRAFAQRWGWQHVETDWRRVIARDETEAAFFRRHGTDVVVGQVVASIEAGAAGNAPSAAPAPAAKPAASSAPAATAAPAPKAAPVAAKSGAAAEISPAVRRISEETGLDPSFVEVAGFLDTYQTGTGFLILPVVGFIRPGFSLTPDTNEVADIFEVPASLALDAQGYERHSGEWGGKTRHYYSLQFEGYNIWGATAGMLMHMSRRLAR